jgi:glycosyltransferase involved in cell wall biosynthesis
LKVIRVVSELDFGGVEQVLANSVPELFDKEGINLQVIVLGKGGRVSQALSDKGIQVLILNQNPRIPNLGLVFNLYKLFKKIRPSVIHSQGSEANFHGILAGHWAGVSTIIGEEIGIPNHHSYWKYIFKWVYGKADKIIAISEAVKTSIIDLGEAKQEKVQVVYNPINSSYWTNSASHSSPETLIVSVEFSKKLIFVSTCRLVPVKNLERLLWAFKGFLQEEKEAVLWLIGEGPEKEKLQELTQQFGIDSAVVFFGFQQDIKSYLLQADVFVLPSINEGSSVSLAEAMACGLPSVVTQMGGAPEVLGKSGSGILVDPLDISSIKDGLFTLAKVGKSERKRMGERAKAEAHRFLPEIYIASLMKIYSR